MQASIDGDIGGEFSLSNDRAHWIVYAEPAAKPGRYFHYRRSDRQVVPLFSTRPALDKAQLVRQEPVVIPTRGDLRLVSYLSRAVGNQIGRPGPTVLLVHDGPAGRDYPDFNVMHQWLANRGYNVLSVNFRGSTGLGKKLADAGDGEWADKMQNDLQDALECGINERVVDEGRVAICGVVLAAAMPHWSALRSRPTASPAPSPWPAFPISWPSPDHSRPTGSRCCRR